MTRRKDGLWQEKMPIQKDGRVSYKYFYGKTKTEVLRKIAEYTEQVETGPSFESVADQWWERHEKTLSPTTVTGYKRAVTRAKEWFAEKPVKEIKTLDVVRFMDASVREWKMSHKSASNQLIVVRQILRFAVLAGHIDVNPVAEVKVPRGLSKKEREAPESDDIANIKASVGCTFGLLAYMALYTGLRKGELLALKWEDIDRDQMEIHVRRSWYDVTGTPGLKEPKTKNGIRTVPLVRKLAEVLPEDGKGYIFSEDGRLMPDWRVRNLYEQYQAESGVNCTLHQLRHAYATMLFENGIEVKDAQRILGHAQASTTQDIYTEIRRDREKIINQKLMNIDIE